MCLGLNDLHTDEPGRAPDTLARRPAAVRVPARDSGPAEIAAVASMSQHAAGASSPAAVMASAWDEILRYARRYPSPHNSQPIKLRVEGARAELFYDLDLGLPAESYGIPFGSVCAGVFIESVSIAAHALGYRVAEALDHTPLDFGRCDRLHPLGTLTLEPAGTIDDLHPRLLLERRTSRLPYDRQPVPAAAFEDARREAARRGHVMAGSSDRALVDRIIRLNQQTLFYDLENADVRAEIQSWLRFSERHARATADGLSARCLALPGPLMQLLLRNHWIWKVPVVGAVLRSVYLRSMRGVTQVIWIRGPFGDERHYTDAGRTLLRIWLVLTRHGLHLHPFGSVITNPRAHRELVDIVGEEESADFVWMLFRVGYSRRPPESHRRDLAEMRLP
jgi:hypothetical protein